jgi:predicted  nucleic acid-binding Zn-ribbon protein
MPRKILNGNGGIHDLARRFDDRFKTIEAELTGLKRQNEQANRQIVRLSHSMKGLHKETKSLLKYVEFVDIDLQRHKKNGRAHLIVD